MSGRTKGTYHTELGDRPAEVVHRHDDGTATVSVEMAPGERLSLSVPLDRLGTLFTADGAERSPESLEYGAEITASHATVRAHEAEEAEQALADARRLAADMEALHKAKVEEAKAAQGAAAAAAAAAGVKKKRVGR